MSTTWLVEYHAEAIGELLKLRDARQRNGVDLTVANLRRFGPQLSAPHMKRVAGTRGLCELRPSGGKSLVRPLYVRFDHRTFKIIAISPESIVDPSGFRAAVARARRRAQDDYGILT